MKEQKIHFITVGLFGLILFISHQNLHFCGDDLAYQHVMDNASLSDYLTMKYNKLGSRLVIEIFTIGFTNAPVFFWRFFDPILIVLAFESITLIVFPSKKLKYSFIVFLMFLLIPKNVMRDAGWCATTLNYMWPLALFLYINLKFKKILLGQKLSVFELITMALASIYAADTELVAALLLSVSALLLLYQYYNSKKTHADVQFSADSAFLIVIAIAVLSLIFILTCPGNASRAALEIPNWYPNYGGLSFGDKLELGVIATFPFYYCSGFDYPFNALLLVCLICLTLLVVKKRQYKNFYFLAPSAIILIIFGICPLLMDKAFQSTPNLTMLYFANSHLVDFIGVPAAFMNLGMSSSAILVEALMYLIVFASLVYCIYKTLEDKRIALLCVVILCAGFCTRLAMGFSPTVYGSGIRTFLYFCMAILMVTFYIVSEYLDYIDNKKTNQKNCKLLESVGGYLIKYDL